MSRPKNKSFAQELDEILKVATKHNVQKLSLNGFQIDFYPQKPEDNPVIMQQKSEISVPTAINGISEDEMLFWSSDHFDELRADREKN